MKNVIGMSDPNVMFKGPVPLRIIFGDNYYVITDIPAHYVLR